MRHPNIVHLLELAPFWLALPAALAADLWRGRRDPADTAR
jgi:hypothetical protein